MQRCRVLPTPGRRVIRLGAPEDIFVLDGLSVQVKGRSPGTLVFGDGTTYLPVPSRREDGLPVR